MNEAIVAGWLVILACFLDVVRRGMEKNQPNKYGIVMRMAKHVYPPTRKGDQVGALEIKATKLPMYFSRKSDYLPEDGAPASKWVGRFNSPSGSNHVLTVLAYQRAESELPVWIVKVGFGRKDKLYSVEQRYLTGPMKPEDFSATISQIEEDIVKEEQNWEPRGY